MEAVTESIARAWASPWPSQGLSHLGAFSEGFGVGPGPPHLPLVPDAQGQPASPGRLLVWVHTHIVCLWEILRSLIIVP